MRLQGSWQQLLPQLVCFQQLQNGGKRLRISSFEQAYHSWRYLGKAHCQYAG